MSERFSATEARPRAEYLRGLFAPYCERVEIAGSLRRGVGEVKDIEIVAAPLTTTVKTGLFDDVLAIQDQLEERIAAGLAEGWLRIRDVEVHRKDGTTEISRRMGDRYKALVYDGIPVDLFIVRPPADWGVVFTIRTGPAEFSERLVTDCQRFFLRVEQGRLLHTGQWVPCPDERDFFAAIGQPWLEPMDRHPSRVSLRNPKGVLV